MEELKPCPFCGGEATHFIPGDAPEGEPAHWVTCTVCEADGPHKNAVPDPVAAWNHRAGSDVDNDMCKEKC